MSESTNELISIVIPVYNEEESIAPLFDALDGVLRELGRPYEIVLVNDGSSDGSLAALEKVYERDPEHVTVINLGRNFGQTAALAAGFDQASGGVIIPMDADLQNDPADIPRLLDKMAEGYDVVSGWRRDRHDTLVTRKIPSRMANWLIGKITGVRIHDYGSTLKSYSARALSNVDLFGDMHRFIPALASWAGVSVAEIVVTHHPRKYGVSKYGINRTVAVLLDLLTVKFMISYKARPIRLFGPWGLLLVFLAMVFAAVLSVMRFGYGIDVLGKPLIAMLMFTTGVQFIMVGLLGEMIMRVYFDKAERKVYVVRSVLSSNKTREVR